MVTHIHIIFMVVRLMIIIIHKAEKQNNKILFNSFLLFSTLTSFDYFHNSFERRIIIGICVVEWLEKSLQISIDLWKFHKTKELTFCLFIHTNVYKNIFLFFEPYFYWTFYFHNFNIFSYKKKQKLIHFRLFLPFTELKNSIETQVNEIKTQIESKCVMQWYVNCYFILLYF